MLFMIYETQPRKVPKQVGSVGKAPTNLVYLHPYLSDFHWKIIAQRVMNFGGDNCLNLLVNISRKTFLYYFITVFILYTNSWSQLKAGSLIYSRLFITRTDL